MSLIEIENKKARRDIIMLLNEDADYAINDVVLLPALNGLGNNFSHDRFKNQLLWLKEQSLVTSNKIKGTELSETRLTQRGLDLAANAIVVEGVARMPL